jgi:predicted transcriptional regulator
MTGKGTLERSIMEALWAAAEPLLVRELVARVAAAQGRTLAYTTVQTVADRLVDKGLARKRMQGKAWRYSPALAREEHVAAVMLEALSGTPDHGPALARFAEGIDPGDARRLLEALTRRAFDALEHGSDEAEERGSDQAPGSGLDDALEQRAPARQPTDDR